MSTQSARHTVGDCQEWLRHVGHVQLEHMTPEMRQDIAARAQRRRAAETLRRRTVTMASHSTRSNRLLSEGLRQMSESSSAIERTEVQERWSRALESSVRWTHRTMTTIDIDAALAEEPAQAQAPAAVWRDEDVTADGDGEAAAILGEGGGGGAAAPPAGGSGAGGAPGLESLLSQLRREPTDEQDVAAKFAMYETYGQEVERMRAQVFAFYDDNRAELPAAVAQDMARQLKRIDSGAAMGIPDQTRDWFVYHMMKQAEKNNRAMSRVLEGFGRKLELLANSEQVECPICLEPFGPQREAETLGCCHCVCGECWDHWAMLMNGRPFCPLCRYDAFMDVIASHAANSDTAAPASTEWRTTAPTLTTITSDASLASAPLVPERRSCLSAMMSGMLRLWGGRRANR